MNPKANLQILTVMAAAQMAFGAGTVITDEKNGYSVTVPAGWTAQQNELGYLLGSPKHDGAILVIPHIMTDFEKAKSLAAEGFIYKEAVQLNASGPVQVSGHGKLGVDLQGTLNGMASRGRMLVGMSPYGGGLILLAGATQASYSPEYAVVAEGILASAQYRKMDTSPRSETGASNSWTTKLKGKKLHYFSTYSSGLSGGMADHKQIGLCSDGSFFYRGDFSASINVPGASGSSSNRGGNVGRWQVQAAGGNSTLVLTFGNGGQSTYTLGTDGSKTFLNGKRWLMEDAKECQ